jgi:hypothetical protein
MPLPQPLYPRKRDLVPIAQKVGWAPGQVWTSAENLAPPPPRIFVCLYSLVLCLYFMFLCLGYPAFCRLLFTYNTNIRAPAGIRTRNLSKLSAADPRLRAPGHWARQFDPRTVHSVASRYTGQQIKCTYTQTRQRKVTIHLEHPDSTKLS